jgi:hypothetical protein
LQLGETEARLKPKELVYVALAVEHTNHSDAGFADAAEDQVFPFADAAQISLKFVSSATEVRMLTQKRN